MVFENVAGGARRRRGRGGRATYAGV